MPQRMASIVALIVFAVCLLAGGFSAGNTFTTTVWRALIAMAGTYVIGLILGHVAQKMLDENIVVEQQRLKNSGSSQVSDR